MKKNENINGVNEVDFKTKFIAGFLSSWCANNYTNFCASGQHKELENPPVEDAEYLAAKSWEKWRTNFS